MNRSTTVTLFAFSYRVAALMRAALVVCFTLGAPPLLRKPVRPKSADWLPTPRVPWLPALG